MVGNLGENVRNKNGRRMINFCTLNELIITNTCYQYKDVLKYTREVESRNERSITGHVLVNKINKTDFKEVTIRRGVETYSDHYLVRAKIRMKSSIGVYKRSGKYKRKINYRSCTCK